MMDERVEGRFSLPGLVVKIQRCWCGGYSVLVKKDAETVIRADVRRLDTNPVKDALSLARGAVEKAGEGSSKHASEWLEKGRECASVGYYPGLVSCLEMAEFWTKGIDQVPLDRQVVGHQGCGIVPPFKLERSSAPDPAQVKDEWRLKGLCIDGEFPPVALGVFSEAAVPSLTVHELTSADDKKVIVIVVQSLLRTAMAEFVQERYRPWDSQFLERHGLYVPVRRCWWVQDHVGEERDMLWVASSWPLMSLPHHRNVRCGRALIQPGWFGDGMENIEVHAEPSQHGPLGLEWSVPVRCVRLYGLRKWICAAADNRRVEVWEQNQSYRSRAESENGRFVVSELNGKAQGA